MKYEEIKNSPERFKTLSGYTLEQFEQLLVLFEDELETYLQNYTLNGKKERKNTSPKPLANCQPPQKNSFLYFTI
jgi:uncharacterized phage-like protein YoqJ